MKIKFLINVPDKYTREMYKKGQVKDFTVKEVVIETATKKVKTGKAVKKTK